MRRNIPFEVRELVHEIYGHQCLMCPRSKRLHLHHVIPVSEGGEDTVDNLIPLCNEHHAEEHPENYWKILMFGRKEGEDADGDGI